MNNTIKFRIWNKNTKQFIIDEQDKTVSFSLITWAYYASVNMLSNIDYLVIQQFTGLKDCNGKEVYEGDIIKYIYEYGKDDKEESYEIVSYEAGAFSCCGFVDPTDTINGEVVGNIYENPDLVKCFYGKH